MERQGSDTVRHFLLPGFCGGLTTFSAVMLLSLQSMNSAILPIPMGVGLSYLLETLVFSLGVVAVCIPIARFFIPERR